MYLDQLFVYILANFAAILVEVEREWKPEDALFLHFIMGEILVVMANQRSLKPVIKILVYQIQSGLRGVSFLKNIYHCTLQLVAF